MKIIKTENGELLNADNIIEYVLVEGEGAVTGKGAATLYGVQAADIIGKERTLGLYETREQAETAFAELAEWFAAGSLPLFEMPDFGGDVNNA